MLVVAAVLALVPELVVQLVPMMLVDVIQQLAVAVVTRLIRFPASQILDRTDAAYDEYQQLIRQKLLW